MENYLSENLKFFQKIDFVLIRLNHLIFVFYRNDQETSFQYSWTTLTFQYLQIRIDDINTYLYQKGIIACGPFKSEDFEPWLVFVRGSLSMIKTKFVWEMTLIPLGGPLDHPIMISINDMIILEYKFMVNNIIVLKYDIIIGQIIDQLSAGTLWEQNKTQKLRLIDCHLKIWNEKVKFWRDFLHFWHKNRAKGMKKIIIMKHTEM